MTEESNEIRDEQVSNTERATVSTPWWRRRVAFISALALALIAVIGGGVATAHKTVTLDIDGTTRTVSTFAGSVGNVLANEDVEIGEHDLVAPATDAKLTDGATIVVRTAEPIEVEVDGEKVTVWTTATDMAGALSELRESGREASIFAASRAADREELNLPLVANGAIRINDGGKIVTVEMAGPATLQQVFDQADIKTSDADKIKITADNNGAIVIITRIAVSETTEKEAIAFNTIEEKTADLYVGQSRVKQEGKAGEIVKKIRIIKTNGKETARDVVSEERTEAVNKIVQVGTKKRPAPAPAPQPQRRNAAPAPAAAAPAPAPAPAPAVGGDVWARLAQCESGGNPRAVSANGLYHGLYQFSVGTWQAVGGSGLPSQASPAEQTKRAQILQARSGWGQWPACSRALGLR